MEIISQCGPLFCTLPKMAFLSSSVWAGREYMCKLNWKKNLLICFRNFQDVPCSYRHSRNRMNTFIIVNITPYVRGSVILYRINLCFLSTAKRPSLSSHLGTHLEEELTDYCFESYLGIPLHSQSIQDGEHFANY